MYNQTSSMTIWNVARILSSFLISCKFTLTFFFTEKLQKRASLFLASNFVFKISNKNNRKLKFWKLQGRATFFKEICAMTQHSYFLIRFPLWRKKMYLDIDPVGWARMSRLSLTFYTLTRCHASQLLFLNSKNVSTSLHCSIEAHYYPKR